VTVSYCDLSHHQAAVNLTAYAAAGHDRIMLKATEGTGFLDGMFASRWAQAGQLRLARGAYHFLRNDLPGAQQWAWFAKCLTAAGGLRPGDWLCVDVEDTNTPAGAAPCARAFTAAAVTAGQATGQVYTGKWYADPHGVTAAIFPPGWRWLWLSDYTPGQADGAIELPNGWTRPQVVARQSTDKATVPGVTGGCDYSRVLHDWLQPEDDMSAADSAAIERIETLLGRMNAETMGRVEDKIDAMNATTLGRHETKLNGIVTAVAATAVKVGALADDEAKVLGAVGGAEQRIITAVQQVIVDPAVDNNDPQAFVAALRDALDRGTAKPPVPPGGLA